MRMYYLRKLCAFLRSYRNRNKVINGVMCSYLVLKYTPSLPLFDERFINYGYNKIQYMEHLRYYRMSVLIL